MNSPTPIPRTVEELGRRRFILEMKGFSQIEKNMLSSTFRLTSRRDICYVEWTEGEARADILLINADDQASLDEMNSLHATVPNPLCPAVLVGRNQVNSPWAFVAKPIHWMRLFERLDEEMMRAVQERMHRNAKSSDAWDGITLRRNADLNLGLDDTHVMPERESVLVVDDSATVRAFMKIKLAPFQFDVDFAENGEEAIEKAMSRPVAKPYTCIFLDIMMPGIDGYEVCKRIKNNPASKSSAVVMLTSKTGFIDKMRANWAGCDEFLSKPVVEDELLATIAQFLSSSKDVISP